MSLLVLILSWGSMGLEAATAVVSAGAGPLGSGTQGAWRLQLLDPGMDWLSRERNQGARSQL